MISSQISPSSMLDKNRSLSNRFTGLITGVAVALLTLTVASVAAPASNDTQGIALHAKLDSAAVGYGDLPLAFEPNVGQAPATTDAIARGAGYAVSSKVRRSRNNPWVLRGPRQVGKTTLLNHLKTHKLILFDDLARSDLRHSCEIVPKVITAAA